MYYSLAHPLSYVDRFNQLESFLTFLLSVLTNFTYKSRNLKALSMTYTQYSLCDLNIVLETKGD